MSAETQKKTDKMKEIKTISPNLGKRLAGDYKDGKARNNSNVPEGMNYCSL